MKVLHASTKLITHTSMDARLWLAVQVDAWLISYRVLVLLLILFIFSILSYIFWNQHILEDIILILFV